MTEYSEQPGKFTAEEYAQLENNEQWLLAALVFEPSETFTLGIHQLHGNFMQTYDDTLDISEAYELIDLTCENLLNKGLIKEVDIQSENVKAYTITTIDIIRAVVDFGFGTSDQHSNTDE